jgi:hypothetical protein
MSHGSITYSGGVKSPLGRFLCSCAIKWNVFLYRIPENMWIRHYDISFSLSSVEILGGAICLRSSGGGLRLRRLIEAKIGILVTPDIVMDVSSTYGWNHRRNYFSALEQYWKWTGAPERRVEKRKEKNKHVVCSVKVTNLWQSAVCR